MAEKIVPAAKMSIYNYFKKCYQVLLQRQMSFALSFPGHYLLCENNAVVRMHHSKKVTFAKAILARYTQGTIISR